MVTVVQHEGGAEGGIGQGERRRHPRRTLGGPPLRAMLRRQTPGGYRYHSCRVLDISAGGVRLELAVGACLEGTVWVRIEGLRLRDWCPAEAVHVREWGQGQEVRLRFLLDEPDEPSRSRD